MSPACAMAYHEMQIILDLDDEVQEKVLADASCNPQYKQIHHLYETWRSSFIGDRTTANVEEVLYAKEAEYAKEGITLHIQKDPLVVVLLTPIMKRAHEKEFAGEIVFVDSSNSCDLSGSIVTFMFAACKVGAIPLALIIHLDQTEANYTIAFQALREAVGSSGFGGKGQPSTFFFSLPEQRGLKVAFPNAVSLLSFPNLCQAFWRGLRVKKNGVGPEKRQELLNMFRKVLYASSSELFHQAIQAVYENDTYKCNTSFQMYFDNLLDTRSDWCPLEKKDAVRNDHTNDNNIIETSIRIFKDCILERCKAFNVVTLVDFVVNNLEKYHRRWLLSFVNMQNATPEMQYRKLLGRYSDFEVRLTNKNIYKVSRNTSEGKEYEIDIAKETCNCPQGIAGKFCKHLCAIHVKEEDHLQNISKLSDYDKVDLRYVACGLVPNLSLYPYMPMPNDDGMLLPKSEPESSKEQLIDDHQQWSPVFAPASTEGQLTQQVLPSVYYPKEEIQDLSFHHCMQVPNNHGKLLPKSEPESSEEQMPIDDEQWLPKSEPASREGQLTQQVLPSACCPVEKIQDRSFDLCMQVPNDHGKLLPKSEPELSDEQMINDEGQWSPVTESASREGQLTHQVLPSAYCPTEEIQDLSFYHSVQVPNNHEKLLSKSEPKLSDEQMVDGDEQWLLKSEPASKEGQLTHKVLPSANCSKEEMQDLSIYHCMQVPSNHGKLLLKPGPESSEEQMTNDDGPLPKSQPMSRGGQLTHQVLLSAYCPKEEVQDPSFYRCTQVPNDHEKLWLKSEPESSEEQLTHQVIPSVHCSKEKVHQAFLGLHAELDRMKEVCLAAGSSEIRRTLLSLRHLHAACRKIKTVAQFHHFCRDKWRGFNKKRISVQPTGISRKVKSAGFTCGAKRFQRGRLSKFKMKRCKTRERPHRRFISISKNVSNARSYTMGI